VQADFLDLWRMVDVILEDELHISAPRPWAEASLDMRSRGS
jgi:hypothetical protein